MRFLFLLFLILVFNGLAHAEKKSIIPRVVINAQKKQTLTTTHAPKTIITQQDMLASGATSLSQALQELAEVQLQDTTGNGSQVLLSMRGFGANASSNTLLLINGIPITNPDMAPPDLNAIPIQEIALVEVISGSESVLYGDQAVGGIINIVTRKNAKPQIGLSCAEGSFNQHNCYASLTNHYKKLRYQFGALANHTDNYRVRNEYGQNLTSGSLEYPYQTGSIEFDYQVANERMQYPGALTAAQVAQNRRQASSYMNFFRDWNGTYHFKDKQIINTNWNLETDLARREMHGDGVLMSPFTQTRTIHFIKPQLKGTLGQNLIITGLDYDTDHYHINSPFGSNDDSLQKYGVFALVNSPLNSKLSFSVGARAAQLDNQLVSTTLINSINRAFATTLGATYQLDTYSKIYARRAENFRFPKADENASTPPNVHGLKTQRGVSYETGILTNWKNISSKFAIYQLYLKDEIQFDPTQTPEDPFGVNRNLDPTLRQGATITEKIRVNDALTLNGQYNFVNARFRYGIYAGKRIPLVSENIFRAGANYKFAPHWKIYAEGLFTGNQYADNDNANIAPKIAGYTIFNMNLRYHFQHFSASFRVNNIFNRKYFYYTVFQPSLNSEFFYPASERNFLLTLKYSFL